MISWSVLFIIGGKMNCPICSRDLLKEDYQGICVERCLRCHGFWLHEEVLRPIIEKRDFYLSSDEILKITQSHQIGVLAQGLHRGLPCPVCQNEMTILEGASHSGVVVDRCMKKHGIWIESCELKKMTLFSKELDKLSVQKNQKTKDVILHTEYPLQMLVNLICD